VFVFSFFLETEYTRANTLLSKVALWAFGFVPASARAHSWGCGSGSSLILGHRTLAHKLEGGGTKNPNRPYQITFMIYITQDH
jgi:hypothetical protein